MFIQIVDNFSIYFTILVDKVDKWFTSPFLRVDFVKIC